MPTTTVEMRVSLMVTVFDLYNRLIITRLIGMFNNKAVKRPGAYVFIKIVEIKCRKKAFSIFPPKYQSNHKEIWLNERVIGVFPW